MPVLPSLTLSTLVPPFLTSSTLALSLLTSSTLALPLLTSSTLALPLLTSSTLALPLLTSSNTPTHPHFIASGSTAFMQINGTFYSPLANYRYVQFPPILRPPPTAHRTTHRPPHRPPPSTLHLPAYPTNTQNLTKRMPEIGTSKLPHSMLVLPGKISLWFQ